jgi:hypothetical protein
MTQRQDLPRGARHAGRGVLAAALLGATALAGAAVAQRLPMPQIAPPALAELVQSWGTPGGLPVPLDLAAAAEGPALTIGAAVKLDLGRGQTAFFRLPQGTDLEAITRRLAQGTDTVMALLDRQGRVLAEDDDGGEESLASRIEVAADQGGPLFLRVGVLEPEGGQFELVLQPLPPPDPTGAPRSLTEAAGQHPVAVGQPLTIRLRGRDEAWIRLPPGGQDLVVVTRRLSPGADTMLSLHDANGRTIAEDDDGGDEQLSSRLEVPGGQRRPLYVRAALLGGAGSFELAVMPDTSPPAPPFPASQREASAAPPLAIGQPVALRLRRGQVAMYRLPEGDIAVVTRNLRRGADTVLVLLDADGAVVAEDDDGGGGLASRIEVAASDARPLFVAVRLLGDATGEFELLVEADAPGAFAFPASQAAAAAAPPIEPGAAVPIRLRRGQSAYFRLPQGPLVVQTRALRDGTDTILEILDESGQVLEEDDDGGDGLASRIDVDGATKEQLYVRAGTLGGGPGAFELVVQRR